jgi:transposase
LDSAYERGVQPRSLYVAKTPRSASLSAICRRGRLVGNCRISPQILGSSEVAKEQGRSGSGPTPSPNGCQGQRKRSPHQARRGVGAVARVVAQAPQLIVLEPTGGLEMAVTAALLAAGLPVAVVNPAQVRAFAQASGQRAKTDTLDARVLARFAERMQPPARPLPDATTQELRAILARRRQLREMHTAELNRRPTTVPSLVPALEAHLVALDATLERLIAASPAWQVKETWLCSIPGIGPVVARTLLAHLPELGTLTR